VTKIAKVFLVSDRNALKEHLEQLAQPSIERLVPCHGNIVSQNAPQVLRGVAHALGRGWVAP
jgi:hypothetical protein